MITVPGLHPKLADAVEKLLAEAKARGLSVGLNSGIRGWERQNELYELGRSVINPDGANRANPRGRTVTKTCAGYSWHNYGTAVDIVFKDSRGAWTWSKTAAEWEDLGKIGELFGLSWGGRWPDPDKPHFELKMNCDVFKAHDLATTEGLDAVWREVA